MEEITCFPRIQINIMWLNEAPKHRRVKDETEVREDYRAGRLETSRRRQTPNSYIT